MPYIFLALIITIVIEGIIILILTRRWDWLLYSIAANLITNPTISVAAYYEVGNAAIIILEVLAFIIEAALYYFLAERKLWRCLLFSLLCNLGSLFIGGAIIMMI